MDYRAAEAWSEVERRVDELRLAQEWVTNHAEGAQWHAGWETVEAEVSDLRRRFLGERDAAKRSSAAERHREETVVLERIDGLLPRLRALEDAAHVAVWDARARDIYAREARDVLQAHGAWHTVLDAAEATDDTVGLDILAALDAEAHRVIRWVGPTNPATPAEVPRQALADLSAARTAIDRELRRGVDRVLMPRVKWTKDTRVSDAGRRDRRLRKASRAAHRHGFASEVFGVEAPGDLYTAAGVSAWWDEADAARDAQDFAAFRRRRTRAATERRVRTERGPAAALRLTPQHRAAAGDTRAGYAAHRKKRVGRFLLSLAWRLPVVFLSGVLASLAVVLAAPAMGLDASGPFIVIVPELLGMAAAGVPLLAFAWTDSERSHARSMLRRTARTLNSVLIDGDTSTLNAVVLDGQQPGALSLQDDMAGAAARAQHTWEQLWDITASRRAFGDFGERWLRTIAALDAWVEALAGADQLRAHEAEEALAVARRT